MKLLKTCAMGHRFFPSSDLLQTDSLAPAPAPATAAKNLPQNLLKTGAARGAEGINMAAAVSA